MPALKQPNQKYKTLIKSTDPTGPSVEFRIHFIKFPIKGGRFLYEVDVFSENMMASCLRSRSETIKFVKNVMDGSHAPTT